MDDMCFSMPLKIKTIKKTIAITENGKRLRIDQAMPVQPGDYVYVFGNLVVDRVTPEEAQDIFRLIGNGQ